MPKLKCPCGFVHNLSPIPDDGWKTIRDRDYEKVVNAHIREEELSKDARRWDDGEKMRAENEISLVITQAWGLLYECPQCGCIYWEREGAKEFRLYRPET